MNNLSGKGIEGGHKTVLKMIATYILPAGNGLVAAAATINRRTESKPWGLVACHDLGYWRLDGTSVSIGCTLFINRQAHYCVNSSVT
jgi:hypothetical protein